MNQQQHVAVISARRPEAVGRMAEHLAGLDAWWYVADGEGDTYRAAGAEHVVEAGPLCRARNRALDDAAARGLPCVQTSDDLRRVRRARGKTAAECDPLSLGDAIGRMRQAMDESLVSLAGCAPTANPFYFNPRRPVHQSAFVVGDLILVEAGCPLRFDEALALKEDYDYTLQHLTEYGAVARCNDLLAEYVHRSNRGGAVAYRTEAAEQEAITYLMGKWPHRFRPNPRRANEVILTWG